MYNFNLYCFVVLFGMARAPKHFRNMDEFRSYVVLCAIRDREGFLDAVGGEYGKHDESNAKIIMETREELKTMYVMYEEYERKSS